MERTHVTKNDVDGYSLLFQLNSVIFWVSIEDLACLGMTTSQHELSKC